MFNLSLHSPRSFWFRCQISRCIVQPEKRSKYHSAIHWSTWKTYEFSRHRCCLALNFGDNDNHLHSHRFKPMAESCVPWKHERRNVVIQFRGCRITKCRNSFTVCKHDKACLRVFVVVHWDCVECELQSNMLRLQQHRFGSGDMPFSVRHLSYH